MLPQLQSKTEAASAARIKMEEVIQKNLSQTEQVIERVQTQVISDSIAKGSKLGFELDASKLLDNILEQSQNASETSIIQRLTMNLPDGQNLLLHDNAVAQICDKANMPLRFANDLLSRGTWGAELVAENFRKIYSNGNGTRYLIRAVGNEARGFLSDKYRRLDVRPLLDTFIGICQEVGAVPIQGFTTDTRVGMRAILPIVFEPIPGECLVFGVNWQNSDFGKGANSISLFVMRLWCLNGATLDEILRQVHIGRKLDDNIEFSQKTIELDTLANISKMKDIVRYAFNEKNIENALEAIKTANEQNIDPKEAIRILKTKLNGSEVEAAIEAYNSPDIVNLPAGNSVYRLSNAVSWISQAAEITTDRRMELDKFAGELFGKITTGSVVEV